MNDSGKPETGENPKRKLLDRVRDKIRMLHYSIRTEDAYVDWIRRFILFHGKRHPLEMGSGEIEAFLTDLAAISAPAWGQLQFNS